MLGITDPNKTFIVKGKYAEELRKQLKDMKSFNVINFDFNAKKFIPYDVIPYFIDKYQERISTYDEIEKELQNETQEQEIEIYKAALEYWKVPTTFDEFKEFIKREAQNQFWARCEYEIILVDWPCQKTEEKWDVFDQIMMNLDIITLLVIESIE